MTSAALSSQQQASLGHQLQVAGAAGPFIATVQAGQMQGAQDSTTGADEAAVSARILASSAALPSGSTANLPSVLLGSKVTCAAKTELKGAWERGFNNFLLVAFRELAVALYCIFACY